MPKNLALLNIILFLPYKDDKKAPSYELLPIAKGFLIWIYFAIQAAYEPSVPHKPLDYKNNGF